MIPNPKPSQKLIIVVLTLTAFILRIYRLDVQSYWIDEGWTLHFAGLPLGQLFHLLQSEEIHPPFYFPTINVWSRWLGNSEFALRYFSLIFSVLAIPLTYRLGRAIGGHRLATIAVLLMTVAPFQIWHAQEARMYAPLTAASVLSMWSFVTYWQRGDWRWWLLYVIGTLWAISTHYHGLVIIGIQGLFLLLTWRRHWRGYLAWAGTLLLIFALYSPWLIFSGTFVRSYTGWLEQPTLWQSYLRSARAYSVGKLTPDPQATWLTLLFAATYGLGLIYAARRRWDAWRGSEMAAFLLAYTIAPNLATWLFGEWRGTSVYLERYLIPVEVGYLLAVAIGIIAVVDGLPVILARIHKATRWHRATAMLSASVLLLLLVASNGWVLSHHYFDPLFAKPDWRAVIRTIEAYSLPGDAILFTGDGGEKLFDYYYRGDLPVYYNFNTPIPPPDRAVQIMADLATSHSRLWFSPYGVDIDALLEGWLAENSYPAWHSWLGRKRLALYDLQSPAGRTEQPNLIFADASGTGPTLTEIILPGNPIAAGDLLPLQLTWQTDTPLLRDYQLSLRLINSYGDIFTQSDWPPLTAISAWPTAQPIIHQRSLWIPPDVSPGDYLLQLVIYDPASGQTPSQPFNINNIAIDPAPIIVPPKFLSIPNAIQNSKFKIQNLTLLGYALPAEIQPGQEMWLWLYWQAFAPLDPRTTLGITISSDGAQITTNTPLSESVGSLNSWQTGQVRRAVYHLPTSPRLTGSSIDVTVRLNSTQDIEAEATIAQVKLNSRPHQFEAPLMAQAAKIAFGESPLLTLIGYDLTTTNLNPGNTLPATLYWQAVEEMETNYTVFIQLLNDADQVVAQIDAQPQAGAAPTTTWLPGEIVTDAYQLPLPAELPPGRYRLITGLYNAATGQRLPTSTSVDFVELGQVTVK